MRRPYYATADFNLTPIADPRRGARLTTALLLALVPVFVATGEEAGLILAGALFCVAWPAFVLVWFDAEAGEPGGFEAPVDRIPETASITPLPFVLPDPRDLLQGLQRLFVPTRAGLLPIAA